MKRILTHVEFDQPTPRAALTPAQIESGVVDWDALPDVLDVTDLRSILRLGRDGAYQWMVQHPGLVFRSGTLKRVPKEGLRRFLARDPAIVALAHTNPYPAAVERQEFVRGAHLRAVSGGRK